jgi:hypothetical protein
VRTVGATSVVGKEAGFVTSLTKYVTHPLLGFHCIVNKEALCAKAGVCFDKGRKFQYLMCEVISVYK